MKTAVIVWGETPQAVAVQLHRLAAQIESGETAGRNLAGTAGADFRPYIEPARETRAATLTVFPGWNQSDRGGAWHHFEGDVSACGKVMRIGGALVRRDVREAGTCPECRRALELPRFKTDLPPDGEPDLQD